MRFTTASSKGRRPFRQNLLLKMCSIVFLIVWISTLIGTNNISNWLLENTLVVLFLAVLIPSYRKFQFSDLSYLFITVFLCLHVYGSKYTYAENPFGYWLKEVFHWKRNHYDRIVHFSFGFFLTYPMRDYFKNWFNWPGWVCRVLPCDVTLSFSAMYELIEWAVADLFFPEQGEAYLGTQGDNWDGQKDMALAFTGSVLFMILATLLKKFSSKPLRTAD
jgi:putative membrane protein